MSSTRNFKSPGIFAEAATTTIPPNPVQGVAYRDAAAGTADIGSGWPYGQRVDSKDWNQVMFLLTSMMGEIDKKGVIGWSDEVDYTAEAVTFGSDGQLYLWLQESGPGTGSGVQDPVSAPTYWAPLNQSGFTQSLAGNGWSKMPNGLIVQWGEGVTPASGLHTVTFPTAFPTAFASISFADKSLGNTSPHIIAYDNESLSSLTVSSYSTEIPGLGPSTYRYIAIGY